jgi:hypothetical protein
MYCTTCPGPYQTTVDILVGEISSLWAMAAVVGCISSAAASVEEQEERHYQAQLAKKKEEQEKAARAKREQEERERQARAKAEEDRREAARRSAEEERRRAEEAERERKRAIAERYEQEKADAESRRAQQAADSTAYVGAMSRMGGGNVFEGTSALFRFGMTFAAGGAPVYQDSTGSDVNSNSSSTTAIGMGPGLIAEFWPVYSKHISLGAYAETNLTWFPTTGGQSTLTTFGYGGRIVLGDDTSLALLGRVGTTTYSASSSSDSGGGVVDANSYGAGSVNSDYYALGLRICSEGSSTWCTTGWDLEVSFADVKGDSAAASTQVYSVQRWSRGGWNAGVSYASGFPTAGTPAYRGTSEGDKSGTLLLVFFGKSWDYFMKY